MLSASRCIHTATGKRLHCTSGRRAFPRGILRGRHERQLGTREREFFVTFSAAAELVPLIKRAIKSFEGRMLGCQHMFSTTSHLLPPCLQPMATRASLVPTTTKKGLRV